MSKGIIGGGARAVGRPTKYDSKIVCRKTRIYIDSCGEQVKRTLVSRKKRSVMYSHKSYFYVPTLAGLANTLQINKDTIQEWRKLHHEFSVLIDELLQKQEEMLVQGSINGDLNPVISKVLLVKHGYREGIEHANPDGSNLFRPNEAERIAAAKALGELSL